VIARYKESIKRLEKRVRVNLFEVDCSLPIRTLEERINEIEYIIEQNYINIIHERIEAIDSELNALKIAIYETGVNLGGEETEERLIELRGKMKLLK
jgi:hypothetical protein